MKEEKAALEAHGYRQFDSEMWRRMRYCDVMFQKCFRDAAGKKYFLTIWGYGPQPDTWSNWHWSVEMTINEPHMEFTQHVGALESSGDILRFEERAEAFWQAMGQPYYERF